MAEELCTLALTVRGGEDVASAAIKVGEIASTTKLYDLADGAERYAKSSRALSPIVAGRDLMPPHLNS